MSITRRNRPEERSGKTEDSSRRQSGKKQNAEELNRNEEKQSPVSGGKAHQVTSQTRQNVPRSESPNKIADQWNQGRHQTTGSNVPGAEIKDRTSHRNPEQLDHTSQDKYPSGMSSAGMDRSKSNNPQQWKQPTSGYTGNSERSGQQYSVEGNSSQQQDFDKNIERQRRNTPGMKNDQGRKEDRSSDRERNQ